MSNPIPSKEDVIEALKVNVDEKQKVIDQLSAECQRLRNLNHAYCQNMHGMHDAYSKPNLN